MAPAAGFTQVLDREVDRYASEEPAAARRCHPGIATRSLLWLERHELARRPGRTLSLEERDALGQLTRLGARLTPDFTREELRRQFRLLARFLHPDAHPGCDDPERARLAIAFATLRSAYDRLKTIG